METQWIMTAPDTDLPMRKNCPEAVLLDGQEEALDSNFSGNTVEYIASCSSMIELSGKAMKRRRSLIRQFEAAQPWSFTEITPRNIDEAFLVERLWQRDEAGGEAAFARRCFRSYSQLRLIGGLLRSGDTAVGYSISAPCGSYGALILVLRAKPTPAGVSAMLYRQTALLLQRRLPALRAINLGSGGGTVELQNRLAYRPRIITTGQHL
ncbi:MAG: phosphatidylglycerol lysyltransferase domain-containing protein [Angelakisella sp.]